MSSGEHSTLVKDEIDFIQTNLRDVHLDKDHGYGFLDGTEEQKEEFFNWKIHSVEFGMLMISSFYIFLLLSLNMFFHRT